MENILLNQLPLLNPRYWDGVAISLFVFSSALLYIYIYIYAHNTRNMVALASPLFPELIEGEILIRLPVKSLVRFRSVCKLWNSLICDPNFIQNHFNRNNNGFIISPKEDEDDDYLIVYEDYNNGPCSLSIISHHNFIEFPIIKPPYSSSDDQKTCLCLVGSINGLVCIADSISYKFIILWNPAIHCFKKIIIPAADEKRYHDLLGFGWDSSANNYKVIAQPLDSKETALYSCNADNWSNHKAIDFGDAYYSPFPSVIVRGIPYWKRTTLHTNHVLKFDVTNNQFSILDLVGIPDCGYDDYSLINLNDHLAITDYTSKTGACVYRFDEQNCIWSKLYTLDPTITQRTIVYCFNYGGDFVFDGMNNLYDPKSKEIKSLRRNNHHEGMSGIFRGFSYTPSMLSLQGMKPLGTSIYEFTNALDEVSLEDKTT